MLILHKLILLFSDTINIDSHKITPCVIYFSYSIKRTREGIYEINIFWVYIKRIVLCKVLIFYSVITTDRYDIMFCLI